jgi:ankyrin repeat protein
MELDQEHDNLTLLMIAACRSFYLETARLFDSWLFKVLYTNQVGLNALFYIVIMNRANVAGLLLAAGGVNFLRRTVQNNITCLYFACQEGHFDLVDLFI